MGYIAERGRVSRTPRSTHLERGRLVYTCPSRGSFGGTCSAASRIVTCPPRSQRRLTCSWVRPPLPAAGNGAIILAARLCPNAPGRTSCLVGTPGLPHRAREVGHPAPLLAAWSTVGPASAAPPSLYLMAEGDPIQAILSPCGGSVAPVRADHSVMMTRLTGGTLCSSSLSVVPWPRLSGGGRACTSCHGWCI
jgi:hypothetical protein